MTIHYNRHKELFKRRTLRNNPTSAEAILWEHLKHSKLGHKFRRQYSVDAFVVDFFCTALKLAVELDGEVHDSPEAKQNDEYRTNYLKDFGINLVRFNNEEVYNDVEKVLEKIKDRINELKNL